MRLEEKLFAYRSMLRASLKVDQAIHHHRGAITTAADIGSTIPNIGGSGVALRIAAYGDYTFLMTELQPLLDHTTKQSQTYHFSGILTSGSASSSSRSAIVMTPGQVPNLLAQLWLTPRWCSFVAGLQHYPSLLDTPGVSAMDKNNRERERFKLALAAVESGNIAATHLAALYFAAPLLDSSRGGEALWTGRATPLPTAAPPHAGQAVLLTRGLWSPPRVLAVARRPRVGGGRRQVVGQPAARRHAPGGPR